MIILGIDVGGSGIKGALVDTEKGVLVSERHRIPTPQPSKPKAVAKTIKQLVSHFKYKGIVGCGFPTVIQDGVATTAGNIDNEWIGTDVKALFEGKTACSFLVMNDADIAGFAEMKFGEGKGKSGMVVMLTVGTGIGSGVFYNGTLIPNIEMGRLLGKDGRPIEYYAGDKARKDQDLDWKTWGKRFDFFLKHIVRTFSPDLFILGGGASKKFDKYKDQLSIETPVLTARLLNNAGIIGAAVAAEELKK
ncbi:MAG: ROK family protein [Saprospiraceae bacterium]|nr:ROK family protein [Saprospiraceae bacterium]